MAGNFCLLERNKRAPRLSIFLNHDEVNGNNNTLDDQALMRVV
jgi:hypothetical protein